MKKSDIKILIHTLVWKRHELFEVFKLQVKRLQELADVQVIVTGSEGKASWDLCKDYNYLDVANVPIGFKAQLGIRYAKYLDFDYMLFLGSDDFISDKTFLQYLEWAEEGIEEIAPMDLYLYEAETRSLVYAEGYVDHRRGEPMAVGRMISRGLLDRLDWQIWNIAEKKWLDNWAWEQMQSIPHTTKYFYLNRTDLFIVDVKTDHNMTPLIMHKGYYNRPDNRIMVSHLPKKEMNAFEQFYQ